MKNPLVLIFSALVVFTLFISAQGQTSRAYVAKSGADTNPCSDASPCKTVTKALTVVDAGGEVVIIESGDYDKFTISKSVVVAAAPGVNAAIVASGQTYTVLFVGLTSSDFVTFRNLEFRGVGDPTNLIGILNSTAGKLTIDECTFSGYDNALTMEQVAGQLLVHDSVFRNNLFGISLFGPTGEGLMRATIDHCKLEQNDTGVSVGSKVLAVIRDTVAVQNTSRGIQVRSTAANQRAEALVINCQLSHNTVGLNASGTNGTALVRLAHSAITNNALTGVNIGTNGTVYSIGDNVIAGNFPDVNGGQLTPLQTK